MSANNMRLLCLMACCLAVCIAHKPYGSNSYGSGSAAEILPPYETAEAQASALTIAAGAAAASAKLDAANWRALNQYGWQQGKPLLVKHIGAIDSLYAAALPPRSFVAQIDPVFKRINKAGSYGEKVVVLSTGAKLAAAAV